MTARPAPRRIFGIHKLTEERFERPILDDDRLLWFGDQWAVVTDLQTPVVEHLLDNLGRPVDRDEITEVYAAAGGSTEEAAVTSLMRRVAAAFTAVGATVRFAYRNLAMEVSVPVAI